MADRQTSLALPLLAWVDGPPSEEIARHLNRSSADACSHGRSICYQRCGVRYDVTLKVWYPIPLPARLDWRKRLFGK